MSRRSRCPMPAACCWCPATPLTHCTHRAIAEPNDPDTTQQISPDPPVQQQWALATLLLVMVALGYYTLSVVGGPEALLKVSDSTTCSW
jgi:hypothetical protein